MRLSAAALLLLFCLSALAGCREEPLPPGVLMLVNGKPVTFAEAEARRVRLFAGRDPHAPEPSQEELRTQYRYVVRQAAEEILIADYMKQKGKDVPLEELEAEEARLRADYPEGGFEEALAEAGIGINAWRETLYRQRLAALFTTEVLRPEVSIPPAEAEAYYKQHEADFQIPEQWHYLTVQGKDRAAGEAAAKDLKGGEDPGVVRQKHSVTIRDVAAGVDRLPENVLKALTPLAAAGQYVAVQTPEKDVQFLVLLEKKKAAVMEPAEVFKRVEGVLLEEKMQEAYREWLSSRLKKASVRVSPLLFDSKKDGKNSLSLLPAGNGTSLLE